MERLDNSLPQDLCKALKEATKEVHTQAENAEFMRNFQKGQVTRKGSKLVMASLYHVYVALEEQISATRTTPSSPPSTSPRNCTTGPHWSRTWPSGTGHAGSRPSPTRQLRGSGRLQQVERREPELLVAHAYTHYLGNLSRGQVLKKIADKALDLPSSGEGLAFFTFPNVASTTKFKQLYRSLMNTLEMTPEVRQRVIKEAKTAFLLNIKLFEELQELPTQDPKDQRPSQTAGLRHRASSQVQGEGVLGNGTLSNIETFLFWFLTLTMLLFITKLKSSSISYLRL
uniref:Heme oxygenase 1 n=1 Tax=Urocitellus parryii TaxID=9999 RepID=A0A8D2H8T6_UROPR